MENTSIETLNALFNSLGTTYAAIAPSIIKDGIIQNSIGLGVGIAASILSVVVYKKYKKCDCEEPNFIFIFLLFIALVFSAIICVIGFGTSLISYLTCPDAAVINHLLSCIN